MAEDGRRVGAGFSSGLAVLLSGKGHSDKLHFVSCYDDIGSDRSVERTLEYIFDLPHNSVQSSKKAVDVGSTRSIIKQQKHRFKDHTSRDGITSVIQGSSDTTVLLDETSICGDLKVVQEPLLVESYAVFSSARANACITRGKWMYEVTLETAGIQQLGWTTLSCQFTDRKGVGDADDSYAYDGKRVSKWNKSARAYGQPWAVGDVIGCCIDLEACEISFYRNGVSLGVAFEGVRKTGIGTGYYPAISLSEGERSDLNFGGRPFRYPVTGFLPLQPPSPSNSFAAYLLQCLSRLLDLQSADKSDTTSFERLRWLKRFAPMQNLYHPISHGICGELFSLIGDEEEEQNREYISWGPLASFMLQIFKKQAPHDYATLDLFLRLLLDFPQSHSLIPHVLTALSCSCRTAFLVLMDCPFSGSYPYLALACNILRHQEMMVLWWKSAQFEYSFEGFLTRKSPNKMDLQYLIPSVWWPGSCEDMTSESSMTLTTTALSGALEKIEQQQRELCLLVTQFIPPATALQSPGSVFRTLLQNLILRINVAEQKVPLSGTSGNSAIVSLYMVILHLLSEGYSAQNSQGVAEGARPDSSGFLHRGGKRSFPVTLFFDIHHADVPRLGGSFNSLLKSCPIEGGKLEEIRWDEGCFEDEDMRVTHSTRQKPCCCSSPVIDCPRALKDPIKYAAKACKAPCSPIPERHTHVASECSTGGLENDISDKPSTSGSSESDISFRSVLNMEKMSKANSPSDALKDEELLDLMLMLYHMGVTPNFKQASYYMSHQSQSISLLEETDKQIREKTCSEQLKRLKEARNVYREELADCVRQCAWYRVTLFSRWKLRGMYASCMWTVELLLTLSKDDSLFTHIPQFYVDALVDCFHALRRSDPPFVSSTLFIKQGLASFVTFIVTHFDDPRISSADLKDLLLQSISVLVQFRDYLGAFEGNREAVRRMPRALLSAFDNRSWILVTNILVRLCKGSGFGSSKHGESSSSVLFQALIRDACLEDEELFSCFLNRLFNTLSWTMTEFSVSIREIQESSQIVELQQRKCSAIFDLSCSLTRILEFCTREIPQVFLIGPDMNLRRLTELIVFVLNHIISAVDSEFFDMTLRRYGQNPDKTNRALILAPLVGIILNLVDATASSVNSEQHDIVSMFTSMDCPTTIHCGFQYLLGYNWGNVLKGDASIARLDHLEQFLGALVSRAEMMLGIGGSKVINSGEEDGSCCICYASIVDAQFEPCHHTSCFGCISRHLLNSQRCFFCNATVVEVVKLGVESPNL